MSHKPILRHQNLYFGNRATCNKFITRIKILFWSIIVKRETAAVIFGVTLVARDHLKCFGQSEAAESDHPRDIRLQLLFADEQNCRFRPRQLPSQKYLTDCVVNFENVCRKRSATARNVLVKRLQRSRYAGQRLSAARETDKVGLLQGSYIPFGALGAARLT